MSFDFMNRTGAVAPYYAQQPMMNPQQQMMGQQPMMQQQVINPAVFETPNIVVNSGSSLFKTVDGDSSRSMIPVDNTSDMEKEKKRRGRPPKVESGDGSAIVRAEATVVEEMPTGYTYMETTNMLRDTLMQIDSLNMELMQEFSNVRHSRTMKNKHQVMIGLTENVGSLISNKISAIREINSSISKSNEMDYKKDKDRRAATANMDDDKYIADLYKSFMQNPITMASMNNPVAQVDPAIFGSGIVRADLHSNPQPTGMADATYLSYMSNLSPEQNLMRYEGNNNVKQVVIFDAASGNKIFQMMDLSTGQVIPNVPVYDQMFMEDVTIDLHNKIAKSINLNETFPVVVINEGVTTEY